MTPLLLVSMLAPTEPLYLLFLGNSHTSVNNLPGMVKSLAESDGSGRKVQVQMRTSAFLEEFAAQKPVKDLIASRRWHGIILQGLKLSSSHKYQYDHTGAVEIGQLAKKHSDNPRFFAEWPRRGWDEAGWIVGQYGPTAKQAGVPIAKISLLWPPVLKEFPTIALWQGDGNHASQTGTYLAACGIYFSLFGDKNMPTWQPTSIKEDLAKRLRQHAKAYPPLLGDPEALVAE